MTAEIPPAAARAYEKAFSAEWQARHPATQGEAVEVNWAAIRAGLSAALPHLGDEIRAQIVATLRLAAEGRRAYAEGAPDKTKAILLDEAATFDTATRIAEGDRRSLSAILPVRMWTQDMHDDLDHGSPR